MEVDFFYLHIDLFMPRVKLFNEEEILQKAMGLFWKNGYYATSIQDLVDNLGVNRGSLYSVYKGKKELFDRSFELYRENNEKILRSFFDEQKDVKKGFQKLFKKAVDVDCSDIDKKGCFVVNTTTEFDSRDQKMRDTLLKNKEIIEGIFYDFLLKGEEKERLKDGKDLRAIASFLVTFFNGIRVMSKVEPNKDKLMASVNNALLILD